MLKIIYGNLEDENLVTDIDNYFTFNYDGSWFECDGFVADMILDIDNYEVVGPDTVLDPAYGLAPGCAISDDAKTLLTMNFDHSKIFSITDCSDKCAKWILEIGRRCGDDVVVNLKRIMNFSGEFEFEIVNSGTIVHNRKEYFDAITPYLDFEE